MKQYEKEVLQAYLDNEKAVLKKLEEVYEGALADIEDRIADLLGRNDSDLKHVVYQVEFQRSLKKQIETILDNLHNQEFENIAEYLTYSYEEGFIGTLYSLQQQGIPLVFPINQEQVAEAIQHDTKISTKKNTKTGKLYASLGEDITDLKKKIAGEISRGFAGSMSYAKIAANIALISGIPKNNAMRIARTEMHRIQTKASMDTCYKAREKGADIVKMWDSTLDGKTRDSHMKVDGEQRGLEEKFSNGLLYPGDPNGPAAEVVNCRCALLQRAKWALGVNETKHLGNVDEMSERRKKEIAKKLKVPVKDLKDYSKQVVPIKAKNYKDFKKQYKQLWQYEGSDLQKQAEERIAGYKKNKASERVQDNVQKMNDEGTILEQTVKISKKVHDNDYGVVDRKLVNSKQFHDKFEVLTNHKLVNEVLYQESMKMLEHRDGTAFEDMLVVDARTGKIILQVTNSNAIGKLQITEDDYKKILEYEDDIILLHNHPNSSRLSHTDIFKLKEKNVVSVVAVGHDGSVYAASGLNTKNDIEKIWKEAYNDFKEIWKDDTLAKHYATDVLYSLGVFKLEIR